MHVPCSPILKVTLWKNEVSSTPKTVDKALSLSNLVADGPGLTLSEFSREAEFSLPTAHQLVRTLEDYGLLRHDETNRYRLGSHCLALGSRFLEGIDLHAQALPRLAWLVEVTGETAHVGVPDGTEVVYLDRVETGIRCGCTAASEPGRRYAALRWGRRCSLWATRSWCSA